MQRPRPFEFCVAAYLRVLCMSPSPQQRLVGTVCELSQLKDKGFGFIKPQDGFKNMFFHVSGDGNEHAQSLVKGQAVSYLPARNRRGPCAIFIKAETQETSRDDTLLETADARQIRARCDA